VHDESVYLGLGSNVGNRAAHLRAALAGLQDRGLRLRAVSSFYLTEPDLRPRAGGTYIPARPHGTSEAGAHPWYVNCAAAFEDAPEPGELLALCREVEDAHGRRRDALPTGSDEPQPRTLDIDVLLMGNRVIDEPGLTVPHPRMSQRRFVLLPLAEIAPDLKHPVAGTSIREMLAALPERERVDLLQTREEEGS